MRNNYTLAVHIQKMSDNGELAKRLADSKSPVIISFVPNLLDSSMTTKNGKAICGPIHLPDIYYSDLAKRTFQTFVYNVNLFISQEGNKHCCERCYDIRSEMSAKGKNSNRDIWHEHVCPDGHAQSLDEQITEIKSGKDLIKDKLGLEASLYCPPNHLWNQDTLLAAYYNGFTNFLSRNGFDYFFNNIDVSIYAELDLKLTMLPESKSLGNAPVFMAYYDDLIGKGNKERVNQLLIHSQNYEESGFLGLSLKNELSNLLVRAAKFGRDFKNQNKH